MALPSLVASLGSGAIMLGSGVVQFVVGRETEQRLVQALADICSRYICSLANTVTTRCSILYISAILYVLGN